jgi:hypothetical protein
MFLDIRNKLIEHYAQMALNPATIDHARLRTKELQECDSKLWEGIGLQIKARMEELKNEKAT